VEATSVLRAVPTALANRSCGSVTLVQSLSAAERRVLQYLRTHLTLAEIGARLYVSRNTVKS
jgi:LuxR family transcriptional regulator, maltose regulon positive regulatory protein